MTTASPDRFGNFGVTRLLDGQFRAGTDVLIHGSGDAATAALRAGWAGGGIVVPVNCFLLHAADGGLMLVDAGTGSAWGADLGHARHALSWLGIEPQQIDHVLLTHLHGDHALGLFDDDDAARYPNAEILVPDTELAHFTDQAARDASPAARQEPFRIADRMLAAYAGRVRPVRAGTVLDGIEMIPLPGHTAGHSGFLLQGERPLLLWGDALHLAEAQPADPQIGLVFDIDPAQAAQTRRSILERASSLGWIVSGGHVDGFLAVARAGDTFRLAPVPGR